MEEFDFQLKEFVEDKIRQLVPSIKYSPNRWNFRCPICGDSKKSSSKARGNYYPNSIAYKCFNGGCDIFLKGLNIIAKFEEKSYKEVQLEFLKYKGLEEIKKHNENKPNKNIKIQRKTKINKNLIKIKNNWIDLNEDANKLLRSRKIFEAPYKPEWMKFYLDTKSNRLVIPVDKDFNFVQLRALYKNQNPKYLNPSKEKPIFNLDGLLLEENYDYIFFTEGIFDCIFVWNCVAILGILPTKKQLEKIEEIYGKFTPVVITDNPFVDESVKKLILKKENHYKLKKFMFLDWNKLKKSCKKIENFSKIKDINDFCVINNNVNLFNKENLKNLIISFEKFYFSLKFSIY